MRWHNTFVRAYFNKKYISYDHYIECHFLFNINFAFLTSFPIFNACACDKKKLSKTSNSYLEFFPQLTMQLYWLLVVLAVIFYRVIHFFIFIVMLTSKLIFLYMSFYLIFSTKVKSELHFSSFKNKNGKRARKLV